MKEEKEVETRPDDGAMVHVSIRKRLSTVSSETFMRA